MTACKNLGATEVLGPRKPRPQPSRPLRLGRVEPTVDVVYEGPAGIDISKADHPGEEGGHGRGSFPGRLVVASTAPRSAMCWTRELSFRFTVWDVD